MMFMLIDGNKHKTQVSGHARTLAAPRPPVQASQLQPAAAGAAAVANARAPAPSYSRTRTDVIWDVFLSYRVDADQGVVKELYWQLCNLIVVEGGKERKLHVFWDRECLKAGERWEEGFAAAISNCHLVVVVMSRHAFAMDGKRHNVAALTETSNCDNVVLEYNLALELNRLKGTAIMPLFVGDIEDGKYTHFFQSGCMPLLGEDIIVEKISQKVEHYLEHYLLMVSKQF